MASGDDGRRKGEIMSKNISYIKNWMSRLLRTNAGRPETLYDLDSEYHGLFDRACAEVGIKESPKRRLRYYTLTKLLHQYEPDDVFVEVGVFKGCSTFQIAEYLSRFEEPIFYAIDSFEGLSKFTPHDDSDYLKKNQDEVRRSFKCSLEQVQSNLSSFPFIRFLKGWVPKVFTSLPDQEYSFIHIDVDLYEPAKACADYFYPKLKPGGCMVFDDYGSAYFPGVRKAVSEFKEGKEDLRIVECPAGSAIIFKM